MNENSYLKKKKKIFLHGLYLYEYRCTFWNGSHYIFIILSSSVIHLSMDPLLLHDVCYLKWMAQPTQMCFPVQQAEESSQETAFRVQGNCLSSLPKRIPRRAERVSTTTSVVCDKIQCVYACLCACEHCDGVQRVSSLEVASSLYLFIYDFICIIIFLFRSRVQALLLLLTRAVSQNA